MTEEKPLHVRVAEALGCKPMQLEASAALRRPAGWYCGCGDAQCPVQWVPPVGTVAGGPIDRYDIDWSATGPLIEKFRLATWTSGPLHDLVCESDDMLWRCNSDNNGLQLEGSEVGATPLMAACNLILALKEAGKL